MRGVHLGVARLLAVQTVMLHDEEDVKQHGEDAEAKLGRVAEYRRPVV